ncbi:hypothetical protein ABMY26_07030 (plasmid) [Azospirillum sp. HJ39]|uniref:hypothetical protein n=1 Tax=Azospirillum sp. HJ39 TaxID=3159496 RepID=UPI003557FB1C
MGYDYRSKTDLRRLRENLQNTDVETCRRIVLAAHLSDLMRPTGFVGLVWRTVSWLRGPAAGDEFIRRLLSACPADAVDLAFNDTLAHMVDGRDLTGRHSAGGWNRDELDLFVAICRRAGWNEGLADQENAA